MITTHSTAREPLRRTFSTLPPPGITRLGGQLTGTRPQGKRAPLDGSCERDLYCPLPRGLIGCGGVGTRKALSRRRVSQPGQGWTRRRGRAGSQGAGVPLKRILGWFSSDLAIDLGTANTLVYARGKGI